MHVVDDLRALLTGPFPDHPGNHRVGHRFAPTLARQRDHLVATLAPLGGVVPGARIHEDKGANSGPMPPPEGQRHIAAHGESTDDGTLDPERVEQGGQVVRVLVDRVRGVHAALAKAAQVGGDAAGTVDQGGDLRRPEGAVMREAVQEDHRIAAPHVVVADLDSTAVGDHRENVLPRRVVAQKWWWSWGASGARRAGTSRVGLPSGPGRGVAVGRANMAPPRDAVEGDRLTRLGVSR